MEVQKKSFSRPNRVYKLLLTSKTLLYEGTNRWNR
jgi:hypothetical protein